jgi:hypothetical protein
MNTITFYKSIPIEAFIIKNRGVIKYVPEINVEILPFVNNIWKAKFPYYSNVNFKDLKLTNIGAYSISSPDNSTNLINLLQELNFRYKIIPNFKDLVVTEPNGGIGGFSIRLSKIIKKINIVEINKLHVDILIHNLTVYNTNFHNIKIFHKDYLDIMYTLEQDVLIFDLPWGGPNYKFEKNLLLGLNNINIWYIINDLYAKNKFKICIIMVPKNFDFQNFIVNTKSQNFFIKKSTNHYYVVIINLQ